MNLNAALAYDGPVANPAQGYQNGTDGWFKSGVTVPADSTDGDTTSGGIGTNTVDNNITCTLTSEPTSGYNATAFLGILASNGSAFATNWTNTGVSFAVPDAVGMLNPSEPSGATAGGQITEPAAGGCFYQIHTHSESGMIHMENPSMAQVTGDGAATGVYTLQNVFDVWGMTPSAIGSAIGQSGSATIIAGTPSTKVNGDDEVTSYNTVSDPTQLTLTRHTAVWIIFGSMPSGGPPPVVFATEN
jgi:hypothetical protein